MAGAASLLGNLEALAELNANRAGAAVVLAGGLVLLYLGIWFWRRSRLRLRRSRELNLSPHLMKKHD
jgi:threonine/homoserine/homoserine lactone efflux protein